MAQQTASKVPQIRFKGFKGAWEEKELGEVADIKLGKMLDKVKHTSGQLLPYLNNISLRWNEVDTSNLPQMYFKDDELERFGLQAGDVVVCEGGEPGRSAIWDGRLPNLKFQKAIHRVRFNVPYEAPLLVLYLQNIVGTNRFEMLFTGGGIKHLTRETFSLLKVPQPSLEEQRDIAHFLSGMDSLIGLHQRKHKKLVALKKAMLQKMFPQVGVATPEIRFKGFEGEWKEAKLGEVCGPFEYGLNASAKTYDGRNKYIRITDIDETTRDFSQADLTTPDVDLVRSTNYLLTDGHILFARTGASVGKTYRYQQKDGRVFFAGFLIRAKVFELSCVDFIFYTTLTSHYEKFVALNSQRSGQPGINASEYSEFTFRAPSVPEQQKIGTYFRTLDQLLSKHATQLQKLQQIKFACLEKMFV